MDWRQLRSKSIKRPRVSVRDLLLFPRRTCPYNLSLNLKPQLAKFLPWLEPDCSRRTPTSRTRPVQLLLLLPPPISSPTTTAPSPPTPGPSRASTVALSTTTSATPTPPRPSPPETSAPPPITGSVWFARKCWNEKCDY